MKLQVTIEGPEGESLVVPADARRHCTEILFNPQPYLQGTPSIVDLFVNSLLKCDEDAQQEIVSNVVIAGGNTCYPGFIERLRKEILERLPSEELKNSLHILPQSPEERLLSAWLGAAKLARLAPDAIKHGPTVNNRQGCGCGEWISKQEYDESGKSLPFLIFFLTQPLKVRPFLASAFFRPKESEPKLVILLCSNTHFAISRTGPLLPSGADDGWILRDAGSSEARHELVGTGAGGVTKEHSSPLSVSRFHPHAILCGSRFLLSRW